MIGYMIGLLIRLWLKVVIFDYKNNQKIKRAYNPRPERATLYLGQALLVKFSAGRERILIIHPQPSRKA